MKMGRFLGFAAMMTVLLVACSPEGGEEAEYTSNTQGLDRRNLDETISPCVDFFQYANGSWLERNPIPPERASTSMGMEVRDRNFEVLHRILDDAAAEADAATAGSVTQKVGHFYAAAMDEARLTELGVQPLADDLAGIDAIASLDDLRAVLTDFHAQGLTFLFAGGVLNDFADSNTTTFFVLQGGLGLPERDYYFRDEDAETRDAYVAHVARMMGFLGEDEATAQASAATVMEMETALAEVSLGSVELRNIGNYYRPVTVAQADTEAPNVGLPGYFQGLGLSVERFSFPHSSFFSRLDTMLEERPLEDWKTYLRWHLINATSPYLSPEIEAADFDFFEGTLSGVEEMEPRWRRALERTDGALGEALGQLYVAEAFPPEEKARADAMIEDLRAALRARIQGLEWMGEETKALALAKLEAFTPKIGYPDVWRDYSSLDVVDGDYFGNVQRARAFEARRNFDKLGLPPDPNEWGMSPPTVNAYYSPLDNEIVFPAGIMQPPLFDGETDDAVNYGAMGAIIGHEMGHGFDDQGSRFDAEGRFANWWTDEDRAEFERRAQVVVDQYAGYEALPGLFVNGELTLGENIGDIGGLMTAYDALQLALEENPEGEIDGFTPEQRFFLSYAQAWRGNQRDEALRVQVNTDPHSPRKFRANGPLANMPEFAEAFGCQAGDPMVRPDSLLVQIW